MQNPALEPTWLEPRGRAGLRSRRRIRNLVIDGHASGYSVIVSERERRVAHNETVFRSANEVIRAKREQLDFGPVDETPFICECGDPRCTSAMLLSLAEYERVRSDPNTFAVIPGHDNPAAEAVVTNVLHKSDRFAVVEKHENVRSVTEATDPRA